MRMCEIIGLARESISFQKLSRAAEYNSLEETQKCVADSLQSILLEDEIRKKREKLDTLNKAIQKEENKIIALRRKTAVQEEISDQLRRQIYLEEDRLTEVKRQVRNEESRLEEIRRRAKWSYLN